MTLVFLGSFELAFKRGVFLNPKKFEVRFRNATPKGHASFRDSATASYQAFKLRPLLDPRLRIPWNLTVFPLTKKWCLEDEHLPYKRWLFFRGYVKLQEYRLWIGGMANELVIFWDGYWESPLQCLLRLVSSKCVSFYCTTFLRINGIPEDASSVQVTFGLGCELVDPCVYTSGFKKDPSRTIQHQLWKEALERTYFW